MEIDTERVANVSVIVRRALAGLVLVIGVLALGQASPPARPWEADIQAFESADRKSPPVPGGVLFVGSSSIRMWETLARDFPTVSITRRGFGGSTMADVAAYAGRIVIPYKPRLVVVYAGDNDINDGKTPERVLADYQALVGEVHEKLPGTRVAFISIKPSLARWKLVEPMRKTNALVREFTAEDSLLAYIDVFTPMLGDDGTPRKNLFLEDGLHLSAQGYALWKSIVAPYLEEPGALMEATQRPRVKICCILSEDEADLAVAHGASALGLVSEMPSGPGVIPDALIARLARRIPPGVAVFLLTSRRDVPAIVEQQRATGAGVIQIVDTLISGRHEDLRAALPGIKLVQVIHVTGEPAVDEALAWRRTWTHCSWIRGARALP